MISLSFGFTQQSPSVVISWSLGFSLQSPAWWSPGPLCSHDTYPPGDILVLRVHTTITRLVISWSFGFTQQSPAWWSPGPLGSHNNYPPGDLLVLWVHTTITRLVISWSFGFTHQSPVWWSTGALVSHSKHLSGDLLVLYVHTTITCMVICWSFGLTQQSPAWWSPGPLGWHKMKSHDCSFETWSRFMCWDVVARRIASFLPAAATITWELHMQQNTSSLPSTYPVLEIFPSISSLKAMLPCSCMVSSLLVPYWLVQWSAQIVGLLR